MKQIVVRGIWGICDGIPPLKSHNLFIGFFSEYEHFILPETAVVKDIHNGDRKYFKHSPDISQYRLKYEPGY